MKTRISDEFYSDLAVIYESREPGSLMPDIEKVATSPFFIMLDVLRQIAIHNTQSPQEASELVINSYSVCLRGVDPFKPLALKRAGIDSKEWKSLLKLVSGDY